MAGRAIELSEQGDELVVHFSYDPRLVEVVRALSRRRFDRNTKRWYCPKEIVVEVVETLVDHGFALAANVRGLYVERGGKGLPSDAGAESSANGSGAGIDGAGAGLLTDRPLFAAPGTSSIAVGGAGDDVAKPAAEPTSLTISELNGRVKRTLLRAFPEVLWVVGEIVGFDRNRHRPYVHFQLMEKESDASAGAGGLGSAVGFGSGSSTGAIVASVDAVLFERTRREIEKKLAACEAPFELKDGIEVRLAVRVDLYEKKGAFQLVVEDVDPVHTLGRIAQNRAAVLAELDKRGLREKNSSLEFPEVPLRVGLITSVGSDAYNDFVSELSRSGFAFAITAVDARMQGAGLERGLLAAIEWFAARADAFDAVAIVRGGGAKTDLLWFDNLKVALAVASCPIKIVSGIGHQRDVSVIDLITHSEKTPTAAAAALVTRVQEFEGRLLDAMGRLAECVRSRVQSERVRVGRCVRELSLGVRVLARVERGRLLAAFDRLGPASRERMRAARRALAEARVRLVSLGRAQARLQQSALAVLTRRLDPKAFALHLQRRGTKLAGLEQLAQSFDPRRVLRRGFAIVRGADGRTLRDAGKVERGREIVATLAHGRLHARVERSEKDEKHESNGGPA